MYIQEHRIYNQTTSTKKKRERMKKAWKIDARKLACLRRSSRTYRRKS